MSFSSTCIAPINIAVIKYWGKSDEDQIIPLNDSLSVTLDTDFMFTKTTATASPDFTEDHITLNNEEGSGDNVRFQNCLSEVRKLAAHSNNSLTIERSKWKVSIVSENNFPTKAGLASSASGFACLVYTLAQLYELDSSSAELSALARRGSGSACRSLFGGFVRWYHQSSPCIAKQVVSADHWPELRCLVAVVSDRSKTVGSTEGMRRSVETSCLLKHRVSHVVPERIELMEKAISEKNFKNFAELTMQDSNQFHAVCLDTYPPLFYMNSTSHAIIQLVHQYNSACGKVKVAYTFDAGPNAVLLVEEADLGHFAATFHSQFATVPADKFFKGSPFRLAEESDIQVNNIPSNLKGQVQYVVNCRVGKGPQIV